MENVEEIGNIEVSGDGRNVTSRAARTTNPTSSYKLFGQQNSIHQFLGGGKAADIILWRRGRVSCGIVAAATIAWFLFERSGLPFLLIFSDVLLIIVIVLFVCANCPVFRSRQLEMLTELELSEEMVHNAAASFRVKINYMLLVAHEIALGKDFKICFKVVAALWLLSIVASLVSFFTLAYIGVIVFITLPALYDKFQDHVGHYAGIIHRRFS